MADEYNDSEDSSDNEDVRKFNDPRGFILDQAEAKGGSSDESDGDVSLHSSFIDDENDYDDYHPDPDLSFNDHIFDINSPVHSIHSDVSNISTNDSTIDFQELEQEIPVAEQKNKKILKDDELHPGVMQLINLDSYCLFRAVVLGLNHTNKTTLDRNGQIKTYRNHGSFIDSFREFRKSQEKLRPLTKEECYDHLRRAFNIGNNMHPPLKIRRCPRKNYYDELVSAKNLLNSRGNYKFFSI